MTWFSLTCPVCSALVLDQSLDFAVLHLIDCANKPTTLDEERLEARFGDILSALIEHNGGGPAGRALVNEAVLMVLDSRSKAVKERAA